VGIFGTHGFFLSGISYDVSVMVVFLFQMVFMDTALTIVTGAQPSAGSTLPLVFRPYSWCDHLSTVRQLGMGRRLLSQLEQTSVWPWVCGLSPVLAWSIRWAVVTRWRWQ